VKVPKGVEPEPTAPTRTVLQDVGPVERPVDVSGKTTQANLEKELKAAKRRASRLEKRIRSAEAAKANLEDHVAILQSSVKSLAEVARNQRRGESYYNALSPILSNVKKTGQDVGLLTQGLGKIYKTLLELNGEAPFEALDDLDRALKWIRSKKKPKESFEGCLVRTDTHNQCLQKLNRTLLERLSNEKQATNVACKRLAMEAVRSTLLEERIKDVDRAYDTGFFQMLAETLACSMEEEGVADLPAGKHLLYDAQVLLPEGWPRMTKAWAVAEPFEGALPNASGGEKDFLMWETTSGADWSVALPEDATFADAEALLVGALGVRGAVFFHGFSGWPMATFVVEAFDASMRVADAHTSIRFLLKGGER
jgi:exonuclease VII small subunit